MATRRSPDPDAVRITSARRGRGEELDRRVRGYLISMTIRVLCFVAAVVVGPGVLRWVLVAGAVLLPYVAVVMANAVDLRQDDTSLPTVIADPQVESGPERHSLAGSGSEAPDGETPDDEGTAPSPGDPDRQDTAPDSDGEARP